VTVGMGHADYQSDIYCVYEWVRRIADQIFIRCTQVLGGLPTGYSLGVCRGQVDDQLDIQ
jgi:hypothetical protein